MLTHSQKCYSPLIERELKNIPKALAKEKVPAVMQEMIAYHFSTGGKRLRPLCVFMAVENYLGKKIQIKKFLPLAIAVELIHNATLIHDDLQDEDTVRRNLPTLWKKYSPAQAINCGDFLFFYALQVIQNAPYEAQEKSALLHLFTEQTKKVIEGQTLEFALKAKLQTTGIFPSEAEYINLVKAKTSALFSMPLLGVAILLKISKSLENLREDCDALGISFQMQDDYLDLWGNKGRGSVGNDLAEGKLSFPAVVAAATLKRQNNVTDLQKLNNVLVQTRENTSADDIQWAIRLMEKLEVPETIRKKQKYFQQQMQKAKVFQVPLLELHEFIQTQ